MSCHNRNERTWLLSGRVAQLEIAILRTMVTVIETTIILIFMPGVFLPVLLILVPMFCRNGTARQNTERYQVSR